MKSDQHHIHTINPLDVCLIVIDSFCGAGGVTYGFCNAKVNGESLSLAVDKLLNVA